ncbi:Trk system potassium transporter TrkA [Desulfobulbus alkaliphilus]|uniref:Trk system potassium transporter TrkA n=1 Tax=Desulfobulbus alkaliphilus TaxID=869814 RepID=UPI001964D5E8|nr:Trk system potassium transporter TrkA [Desulfobulbus alkaliphilus]MBM9538825.1 Trk system potassium transporter TrkA [Desulfobulbus alkaliphilus]
MHIVIIGGGDVGYELARSLNHKNQSIVVVDRNPATVKTLGETLDLPVINGNGANLDVLQKARIKSAQMLIAVTESDEVNIIACMIAKTFGVKYTVARVRKPESAGSIDVDTRGLTQTQLGIDLIISPEKTVAREIAKRIHFPDAMEVEYYADGKAMHMAVHLAENAEIANKPLHELSLPQGCIVVGIKRTGGDFLLPGGKDTFSPGDKIYLIGKTEAMGEASWYLHRTKTRVNRVVILGGGEIGYSLATLLESDTKHSLLVKLIEKDEERVDRLNRELSRTIVLQGDGTDLSYFNEEEISEADVLVAATGDDRTNMVASMMGQKLGVKKVITEVTRIGYAPIYGALEIFETINPHLITASKILKYTRWDDVLALSLLQDEVAETMELVLPVSAEVVGKKISEAGFPQGLLVGTIVRNQNVIIPDGDTQLMADDHLIVFSMPKVCTKLDRYFACKLFNH